MFLIPNKSDDKSEKKLDAPSILSNNIKVMGEIKSEGEVHIDGQLVGDIQCDILHIGVNGMVKGKIRANTLRVSGAVEGRIIVTSVFLASTARIVGDVFHESIAIEPGAFVNGICRHREDDSEIDGEKLITSRKK
jgi:cytoskeletal protein CcmA (bactofilin family)